MEVSDKETVAQLLVELFRGRSDAVAVQEAGKSSMRAVPIPAPLQPSWLVKTHLAGSKAVGVYPVLDDGNCWWCGADIDDHDSARNHEWFDQAMVLCAAAAKCDIHPLLALSQSGRGSHVLLFFHEPVPAPLARRLVGALGEEAKLKLKEIYPKQDSVESKRLGNCLRLPFWGASKLLCWETGADIDPVEGLQAAVNNRIGLAEVMAVIRAITGTDAKLPAKAEAKPSLRAALPCVVSPRVARLIMREGTTINKRWHANVEGTDGSRSGVMQSLANELVRHFVPTHEVADALMAWATIHDYQTKAARILPKTLEKAYSWVAEDGPQASKKAVDFVGAVELYLEEVRAGRHQIVPFGIAELDESIDGIGPGQLCIVAGRPGHGKSLLGLQWADTAARMGHRCLFVSEEMGVAEIGQRVANWDAADDESVLACIQRRYEGRPKPQLIAHLGDLGAIERTVEHHVEHHGVDCVIIDYLQLLASGTGGQYEIVSAISRKLKRLASRLNIRLMVLCQSNRQIELRENKIPQNSDLRDSGQIEQDADLIVFCVWPLKLGVAPQGEENHYYFCCTKRRNGPVRKETVESRIWPDRSWLGIGGPDEV